MSTVATEFESFDRESDASSLVLRLMLLQVKSRGLLTGLLLLRFSRKLEAESLDFLRVIKAASVDRIIDPSGEIVDRLTARTKRLVDAYEALSALQPASLVDRWVNRKLLRSIERQNVTLNEAITWINEHDADASGRAEGGPHTSVDAFITSLS